MTTKRNEVYKCSHCGQRIEALSGGGPIPVCCGDPTLLLEENTVEASKEKHIPVIEKTAVGYKVSVGSVAHPMMPEHYIEWIELLADGQVLRQYLSAGQLPAAEFRTAAEKVTARAYCNLHGLWKA